MAVWLEGQLDVGALREAVCEVVRRHAVLRTRYEVDASGGVFVQRVGSGGGGGEALLREVTAPTEAAASEVVSADAARGFTLIGAGSVPLRCTLVRVDGSMRHLLLVNVHHVAFDGASTALLLREVGALYA